MSSAVKIFKHFEAPKEEGVYHRLVCLTGKNKGQAYFLLGKRAVLGRSDKADIRVLDIKSSREHAEIIKVGRDYVLTDLGSQNGIVVNDLKIKQHVLNEGDKVIIGKIVYKFNKIEVKPKAKPKELKKVEGDEQDWEDEEFEPEKKSKSSLLLGIIILGAVVVLLTDGEDKQKRKKKRFANYNVNEIANSAAVTMKGKRERDKKIEEKLNIYFHKGLREYREGNYFRALSEFEHALAWAPDDVRAMRYKEKTKKTLDKLINELFLNGRRDEDALKYQKAVVSYCKILRLLYRYPKDERYLDAKEAVTKIEGKLGLDEGAIECVKEIK